MNEFGQKGYITDEDFMINVLNNLILHGLENNITVTGDNALTINIIHKKIIHWYEKYKSKKEKKRKALKVYNKQYKQRCHKCGKYSHKPGNPKCPENKMIKMKKI